MTSGVSSFFRPPPSATPGFIGPPAPGAGGFGSQVISAAGALAGGILSPIIAAAPGILTQAGTSFIAGKLNRALSLPGGAPLRPSLQRPGVAPLSPFMARRPISAARPPFVRTERSGMGVPRRLQVAPTITAPIPIPVALPGGAMEAGMPAFPVSRAAFGFGTEGLGFGQELTERLGGLVGGQTTLFRQGMVRVHPVREITERNPMTGRIETWRHMGRAVLFSGDFACAKRVAKIARRAKSRSRSFR